MDLAFPSLDLYRVEFALTVAYHYLFVPLSIGLIVLIALMESIYLLTKHEAWRNAARFWGWFFFLSWFMGLLTGLPLRWQLTNHWGEYGLYAQEIIGRVLRLEAYIAPAMFGLSGLFYFGWSRFRPHVHCLLTWTLVALLCAQASGMLILNGWMQHPVGAALLPTHAVITSLQDILLNPTAIDKIVHTMAAAVATGCMFVFSISTWYCAKQTYHAVATCSLKLAASIGMAASFLVMLSGHSSVMHVADFQPIKFAAFEGLWTTTPAPAPLTLIAIPNTEHQKNNFEIKIPYLLGILMGNSSSYSPVGMQELTEEMVQRSDVNAVGKIPKDYLPDVSLLFISFRIMVFSGVLMLCVFIAGFWNSERIAYRKSTILIRIGIAALPLPWICTIAGWIVAEAGRQPWLVYGVLSTKAASATAVSMHGASHTMVICAYIIVTWLSAVAWLNYLRFGPALNSPLPWPYVGKWATTFMSVVLKSRRV